MFLARASSLLALFLFLLALFLTGPISYWNDKRDSLGRNPKTRDSVCKVSLIVRKGLCR